MLRHAMNEVPFYWQGRLLVDTSTFLDPLDTVTRLNTALDNHLCYNPTVEVQLAQDIY